MKLSLIAAFAFLSVSAIACGGAGDRQVEPPSADEEALKTSKALSQDLVCAAIKAAEDNPNQEGLVRIKQSALKGDALKDFKDWQKNMLPDYPSSAYELPVELKGKTYKFVLVSEMNDGGGSIGIYRESGETVTYESGGESATLTWSAPGDKCSQ
ncbi:MAG: hypothetical protein U0235_16515 [Polyangiaceae bacterium]